MLPVSFLLPLLPLLFGKDRTWAENQAYRWQLHHKAPASSIMAELPLDLPLLPTPHQVKILRYCLCIPSAFSLVACVGVVGAFGMYEDVGTVAVISLVEVVEVMVVVVVVW